jgi:hypothetical protein
LIGEIGLNWKIGYSKLLIKPVPKVNLKKREEKKIILKIMRRWNILLLKKF